MLKSVARPAAEAAYQNATTDALQRVAEPVGKLLDRMKAYSEREKEKLNGLTVDRSGTFKDTIIGNVQDIAAVFRSFNLTNDPFMERIASQLDAFDGIEADDLRNSQSLRDDVAKRAAKILDDLKDLI